MSVIKGPADAAVRAGADPMASEGRQGAPWEEELDRNIEYL